MSRTKWAAVAIAVITLGAAGCSKSDASTGAIAAPVSASPRPKGTGPLTKEVVRADLDTSLSDAGAAANDPEYARRLEEGPASSPPSCVVVSRSIGNETTPLDFARYKAVVGELRERAWQQSGGLRERENLDGVIGDASATLRQRGWIINAQYGTAQEKSAITLMAYDDACMKKSGIDASPLG
ncbi:hypothetical protein GCM10010222_80420 [Streptomyces tanashiensis]|uniref:hypothetical protein n=1 Tax=Streptomyces tanashiensis TaxID=67367 RepID=UPI001675E429|nr:hypothetical protein [Streptomyces tanashiensis]GGT26530.1 hypothetical protein GCM10010222_80420 [Streptomyces tanashiensis]